MVNVAIYLLILRDELHLELMAAGMSGDGGNEGR